MQTTWSRKIVAVLQLMRFPNLFTAMGDVLAGYFIVMGGQIRFWELVSLLVSTTGIYAGGCALNDIFDRDIDDQERPFRPIPSGRITLGEAKVLAGILFTAGLAGALWAGGHALFIAFILVILVLFYDGFTKEKIFLGPLNMGACRSLNLLLGMSPALSFSVATVLFPIITLVYVASLTVLSRFEVYGGQEKSKWGVLTGWGAVILTMIGLIIAQVLKGEGLVFLGLLVVFTAPPFIVGFMKQTPDSIGKAVKFLVLGIPLLDATYVAGISGWPWAIPVAFCVLPPLFISRYLYVT